MYIGWDNQEHEDAEMDNMLQNAREEETIKKVAFVDLDRVVVNPDVRFARAEEVKQRFITDEAFRKQAIAAGMKNATDAYWREAFNPAHVPTDELIDGAEGDIIALTLQNYAVIFLTSRLSSMWDATVVWLEQYNLLNGDEAYRLVMKEEGFKYVKTVVWKAGMVQQLARQYQPDIVLFITDQQAEIDELQKFPHPFTLKVALSLDEAVNGKEDEEDNLEHPF